MIAGLYAKSSGLSKHNMRFDHPIPSLPPGGMWYDLWRGGRAFQRYTEEGFGDQGGKRQRDGGITTNNAPLG